MQSPSKAVETIPWTRVDRAASASLWVFEYECNAMYLHETLMVIRHATSKFLDEFWTFCELVLGGRIIWGKMDVLWTSTRRQDYLG